MDRKNSTQDLKKQNASSAGRGVDHTLTPGQNPLPPDSEDVNTEYNRNEKVGNDQKMYANKKSVTVSSPHEELEEDDADESGVVD